VIVDKEAEDTIIPTLSLSRFLLNLAVDKEEQIQITIR
jgi:hypothetical protein